MRPWPVSSVAPAHLRSRVRIAGTAGLLVLENLPELADHLLGVARAHHCLTIARQLLDVIGARLLEQAHERLVGRAARRRAGRRRATSGTSPAPVLKVQYWLSRTGTLGRGNGARPTAASARMGIGGTRRSRISCDTRAAPAAPGHGDPARASRTPPGRRCPPADRVGESRVVVGSTRLVEHHVEHDDARAALGQRVHEPAWSERGHLSGVGWTPELVGGFPIDAADGDLGGGRRAPLRLEEQVETPALLEGGGRRQDGRSVRRLSRSARPEPALWRGGSLDGRKASRSRCGAGKTAAKRVSLQPCFGVSRFARHGGAALAPQPDPSARRLPESELRGRADPGWDYACQYDGQYGPLVEAGHPWCSLARCCPTSSGAWARWCRCCSWSASSCSR